MLNQEIKSENFVADFDERGLSFAKYLGSNIIDLKSEKIESQMFDFISFIHVLEHLTDPEETLNNLKNNLNKDGYIYAEVPNLYGGPMSDEAHLTTFSIYSLIKLFENLNFEIISFGYLSDPKHTIKFGGYYNNQNRTFI